MCAYPRGLYVCVNYDTVFVPTVVTNCSPKPAEVRVLLNQPEEVLGNVCAVGE